MVSNERSYESVAKSVSTKLKMKIIYHKKMCTRFVMMCPDNSG